MFTFVIAKCSRIYGATVHSRHLSTHSVIPVTWVYALALADINTPPQSKCIPSSSQRPSNVFTGRAFCRVHICIWTLKFKSNILSMSISFQFYQQTSKTTQTHSSYFSCIFTDIISMSPVFSMLYIVWRFMSFASVSTIWFWVEEAPTNTLALPDDLAARWPRR